MVVVTASACGNGIGDFPEPREIDIARTSRTARNDDARPVFCGKGGDGVMVAPLIRAETAMNGVEPFARQVRPRAVGQVPAGVERHAEDRAAWLQQRQEHRLIGLAARTGLDIGKVALEQGLGSFDRKVLRFVNALATPVMSASRTAFCAFAGQHGPRGIRHRLAHDVLRGDPLDFIALTAKLTAGRGGELGIRFGQWRCEKRACRPVAAGLSVHGNSLRLCLCRCVVCQ